MAVITSFEELKEYQLRQHKEDTERLVDKFLGIGVCKSCGFKHPSILRYCEMCLEYGSDTGLALIRLGEYRIRKRKEACHAD